MSWCGTLMFWCDTLMFWCSTLMFWCRALNVWCGIRKFVFVGYRNYCLLRTSLLAGDHTYDFVYNRVTADHRRDGMLLELISPSFDIRGGCVQFLYHNSLCRYTEDTLMGSVRHIGNCGLYYFSLM